VEKQTMKRPRFEKPVFWHVMARGARRLGLFWDDEDFRVFLGLLKYSTQATDASLVGYTLMGNHFHMILEATSLQLTACMRRVDHSYSLFHNDKHGLSGHTFDGPYQAYAQPTPRLALRKLAYVFLNPVRAGLCALPEEYPWSNIGDYWGQPEPFLRGTLSPFLLRTAYSASELQGMLRRDLQLEMLSSERRTANLPTAREVQTLHYEWLRDLAVERSSSLEGEDPHAMARLWARECGVFPSAMVALEPGRTASQISRELWKLRKRLAESGSLKRLLSLAS
jgi:putative transposase